MLIELNITNFAIIDKLCVVFRHGFNALTGETGAGKSIIIDALGSVLGGRTGTEVVRAGCESARIEALFDLQGMDKVARQAVQALLEESGIEMEDPLILSREIGRSGRNVCRINGRATSVSLLNKVGQMLVDIHGQSDHLSLLRPVEHVHYLDRYAGLTDERLAVESAVRRLRDLRNEIQGLIQSEREVARRLDLLNFQTREIAAARLKPGEEETLIAEHGLLSNAEQLSALSASAYASLYESGTERPSAIDLLSRTVANLAELARLDPELNEQAELAESLSYQLEELARSLRSYRDGIEFNPTRLSVIEERLELMQSLKRKYGNTIDEILQFYNRAENELNAVMNREERIEELLKEETSLKASVGALAFELSAQRQEAALSLSREIEGQLQDLTMTKARFAVSITQSEATDGVPYGSGDGQAVGNRLVAFDETGVDRVEFLLSANPGEPLKSMAKVASGGETSRIMLAMKTILSKADPVATMVFDEVDVGVGGRIGYVVGQKLWGLTRSHQVLCITHLPQIASFGDAHFSIYKQIEEGRTVTKLRELTMLERIVEIAQMLGTDSDATRRSAEEMMAHASEVKRSGG